MSIGAKTLLQQVILLVIALIVPIILFLINKPRWVLGWVCITLSVHVFDTTLLTNLAAARVVGLLYLPYALLLLPYWIRLTPAWAYILNFGYLLILGFIFGFIIPWPDTTGLRPFILTAPGRMLVYPTRLLADLALTIFMAREFLKPGTLRFVLHMLILGATISAAFGVIWLFVPGFDPYYIVTGLRGLNGIELIRSRGLSFEPRGLGMACAYALLLLLVDPWPLVRVRLPLMLVNLIGFMTAYSTSGIALILIGLLSLWFLGSSHIKLNISLFALVTVIMMVVGSVLYPERIAMAIDTISVHFDGSRLQGVVPTNFIEQIAYLVDSFDASTILFLAANPFYILTGTGPAMIMLPATEYLPPGLFSIMYGSSGINGLPTLGLLLELANSGLIGLLLWFTQVGAGWRALSHLYRNATAQAQFDWYFAYHAFLIGVVFYLLQVSITSPYWSLFSAIGWAAYYTAVKQRQTVAISAKTEQVALISLATRSSTD